MRVDDKTLYFVVPGDINTRTGGYRYDKRIVAGLQDLGWTVHLLSLPGEYPFPDAQTKSAAAGHLAQLPDGCQVVFDGLAFSVLPDQLQPHAARVNFIALIHHPLCAETGLEPDQVAALHELETRALALATNIVTTSPSTAESLVDFGIAASTAAVVCPGTDTAPIAKGELVNGHCKLLCVATLTERKGHSVLLDALKQVEDLPWSLVCAGSPERNRKTSQALFNQCKSLEFNDRVSFAGELDDDALADQYLDASAFILCSFHEGYGMVLDEAIAYGLPVIATRGGAIADTLPPGASLLVTPGDTVELAAAIRQFITDTPLRESLRSAALTARQNVRSWNQAAAEFESVLLN